MFLATWHSLPDVPPDGIDWNALIELRGSVLKKLEESRVRGEIGAPLEAEVDLHVAKGDFDKLNALGQASCGSSSSRPKRRCMSPKTRRP